MKKFAIIAAVFAGFLGFTAAAEAGYFTTRVVGYDHCGRPIVRQVYVETCQPRYYSRSYSSRSCGPSYSYGRSRSYSYGYSGGYGYRSYRSSRCR